MTCLPVTLEANLPFLMAGGLAVTAHEVALYGRTHANRSATAPPRAEVD